MGRKAEKSYESSQDQQETGLFLEELKQRRHSFANTDAKRNVELVVCLIFIIFLLYGISKSSGKGPSQMTRKATRLLSPLLSEGRCECIIGDLQEEYEMRVKATGLIRARLWFHRQVLTSVWPLLYEIIKGKLSFLWKTVR